MKVLFAFALVGLAAGIYHDGDVSHGFHVHKFKVVPTSPPPIGYENAMNGTLELELHAGDVIFYLDLLLKTRQWAPDAQIILESDENGNPTKTAPLFYRGYSGNAFVKTQTSEEYGHASVTFFEDGRASMAVLTDHDIYNVELNEFSPEMNLKGEDKGHKMYLVKMSDVKGVHDASESQESDPVKRNLRKFFGGKPGQRRLTQLIPFTNCFSQQNSQQRAIKIAMMADPAFQSRTGGATQATNAMIADLNKASDVYYRQLRVWLLAGQIYSGSLPANSYLPCSNKDTSGRLTRFRDWRRTKGKDQYALYHLFTNCHPPPGTVGLAYVNVLCSPTYGTGWSNYMSGGRTWLVVAHELGHNFGSPHSFDNGQGRTGGIMDYGDGYYPAPGVQPTANRAIAFNPLRKNDICGAIQKSLNAQNSYLIPPNQCWTTYGGTVPQPTPQPTNRPTARPVVQPVPTPRPIVTRRPTRRPTPSPPAGSPCRGITMTASWYFRTTFKRCYWYQVALRRFKPCIPAVTRCSFPYTSYSRYGYVLVKMSFTTSWAEYRAYNYGVWKNGIAAQLRRMGVTISRRRLQTSPPLNVSANATDGEPETNFVWVRDANNSYDACSVSCGLSYSLPTYICEQDARFAGSSNISVVQVNETNCPLEMRPLGTPQQCTTMSCGSCGDGKLDPSEVCDTALSPACCQPGCQAFKTTQSCLTSNNNIEAVFLTCLNDVQSTGCYLYVFQGEYFKKYEAVAGYDAFYQPAWTASLKHRGIFQHNFTTLTAVAGGRNGQVWAFNGLDFIKIDYSNENNGKMIGSGRVDTTWNAPAAFSTCGRVTAADVVDERWIMIFCDNVYIYIDIVTEQAQPQVYPADTLFPGGNRGFINAFYFDQRDNTYRIIRRDMISAYEAPALQPRLNATLPTIFGTGTTPNIASSSQCQGDPECRSCTGVNHCVECNPGFKVLVHRCIQQEVLIDMQFHLGSTNDEYYLTNKNALQNAVFTADQGNTANAAVMFDRNTNIMTHAPQLNGQIIKDFRIEVFYKPSMMDPSQLLVTIDSRFEVYLQQRVGSPNTMQLFVKFDALTFDCYVDKPLTVGQWNLVAVEFANRQIITSVNGFEHNRAFSNIAGGPAALGLTFQNVTLGGRGNGLRGAVDSFVLKQVPVTVNSGATSASEKTTASWVVPVAIVASILGLCLIAGLVYLAVQRGVCGEKSTTQGNDIQTAFLHASAQSDQEYIAM